MNDLQQNLEKLLRNQTISKAIDDEDWATLLDKIHDWTGHGISYDEAVPVLYKMLILCGKTLHKDLGFLPARYLAFEYGPKITELDLSGVKTIDKEAFYQCSPVKLVNVDGVKSIGYRSFMSSNITNQLKFENVDIIISEAFRDCMWLKELPFTTATPVTSFSSGCFKDCANLDYIELPVKLEFIDPECFMNCGVISKVVLTKFLANISRHAFRGCIVKEMTYPGTIEDFHRITSPGWKDGGEIKKIICSDGII